MSLDLMGKVLKLQVGLTARKMVLLKMADCADDNGKCFPSMQHIADQCEMSRRSVCNHVKKLTEDGFLVVKNRFEKNEQKSNIYHIKLSQKDGVKNLHTPSETVAQGGSENSAHRTSHSLYPLHQEEGADADNSNRNEKSFCTRKEMQEWWNTMAIQFGLPQIKAISDARWQKVKTRGRELWLCRNTIIDEVRESNFIRSRSFFTFDWLIVNDTNWLKVIEGNFRDDKPTSNSRPDNSSTMDAVEDATMKRMKELGVLS